MADGAGVDMAGGWSPAMSAEAQRRWLAGESGTQIAKALAVDYRPLTRNAVMAHIWRVLPDDQKRTKPTLLRFAWTPDRRTRAIAMADAGQDFHDIAAAINAQASEGEHVTVHSVRSMIMRHRENGPPTRGMMWSPETAKLIGDAWLAGKSGAEIARLYSGKVDGGRTFDRNAARGIAERAGYIRPEAMNADAMRLAYTITARRARDSEPVRPSRPDKPAKFNKPAYLPPVVFGNIVIRRPDTQREVVDVTGMLALPLWQRPDNGCCFVCGEAGNGEALYCSLPVDRNTRQKTYCAGHHNNMRRPSPHKVIAPPAEGPRRIAAPKADSFLGRWA